MVHIFTYQTIIYPCNRGQCQSGKVDWELRFLQDHQLIAYYYFNKSKKYVFRLQPFSFRLIFTPPPTLLRDLPGWCPMTAVRTTKAAPRTERLLSLPPRW
jgi:hypothetical protein